MGLELSATQVNNRKRPYRAEGLVNLGGVLSCRTEGVRSPPRVRGGAFPAYSAVPKSQELGQIGAVLLGLELSAPWVNNRKRPYRAEGPVNLGGVQSPPRVRGGASPAYSAVPKSREFGGSSCDLDTAE